MAGKQTGYDFWNNVLHSPRYVAAPMVDMSELAFRMLCRRYGAQLCYSPMLHSSQFSQDFLYRKDNFSTCVEDRPLIVQFCANDPNVFVNAASMVSSECDAIDLNLGCPQAIAKKGYYGSFLQEDWDLIRGLVQKASSELPVPVTCKIRILPGHLKQSVEYAKMLEHAGCSVLTVHGRTREQKGHATGLASWEVIREIKANVKIPVIANGNILTFDHVQDCLRYTGADAVMSAEALLHNPALFSGTNPPVWKIVQQYLQLAEKYDTPIRCVRCHLFKILYLCIYQCEELRHVLTEGSSLKDFSSVIEILKQFPDRFPVVKQTGDEMDNILNFPFEMKGDDQKTSHLFNSNENAIGDENENILEDQVNENYLPLWLCHSRPRIAIHDKSRGCFSKYFDSKLEETTDENQGESYLSTDHHRSKYLQNNKGVNWNGLTVDDFVVCGLRSGSVVEACISPSSLDSSYFLGVFSDTI
ncbi:hypothetical protein TNCV_4741511 [Trichonephila clavipes]|nr:hypothetical protein TNCV_4741511 [Trichonephila clavipes]